jgi:putative aldouronate transport system substrate-binding protein
MIVTSYLDDMGGSFASGYDIKAFFMTSPGIQVPFYVVDGQVKCSIVEDDFVSYIEMLQGLMADGLTAKDIESYTNENSYKDKVLSGETGLFWGFGISDLETLNAQLDDGYFTVLPMMRQTEDQVLHFVSEESYAVKSAVCLSANCSNVDLACQWLDAHYTDEVSMLAMYGIEGVSYEYDGDTPHYTEMMTDTSEGLTLNVNKALYCLAECDNIYYGSINTDLDTYTQTQIDALEYINSGATDDAYVYPDGASMTTEETTEYTDLIADLSTYMAEHVLKFVVGDEDMAEYQSFIDTLYDMGMQRAIDLKQAAYDRYVG